MKVRCLVTDEYVTEGNIYDVLEVCERLDEGYGMVQVYADGEDKNIFPKVYLTNYPEDPEFEVVEE